MDHNWRRLADLLIARRVEIAGHRNRAKFGRDLNIDQTGMRLIGDLETSARDNYERGTLAWIENTYQWEAGSVGQILAGGLPTPKPLTVQVGNGIADHTQPLSEQNVEDVAADLPSPEVSFDAARDRLTRAQELISQGVAILDQLDAPNLPGSRAPEDE